MKYFFSYNALKVSLTNVGVSLGRSQYLRIKNILIYYFFNFLSMTKLKRVIFYKLSKLITKIDILTTIIICIKNSTIRIKK